MGPLARRKQYMDELVNFVLTKRDNLNFLAIACTQNDIKSIGSFVECALIKSKSVDRDFLDILYYFSWKFIEADDTYETDEVEMLNKVVLSKVNIAIKKTADVLAASKTKRFRVRCQYAYDCYEKGICGDLKEFYSVTFRSIARYGDQEMIVSNYK